MMFEPRGERPQWQLALDVLERHRDVGDLISYAELNEALEIEDIRKNRSPVYRAAQVWGEQYHRALVPVPNEGYRVAAAYEHEILARRQHRKSKRALVRGRRLVHNADRSQLSSEQIDRFERIELTMSRYEDMIRRLDARQSRLETRHSQTETMVAENRAEIEKKIASLEDLLRRHGIEPEP